MKNKKRNISDEEELVWVLVDEKDEDEEKESEN